jgi:beta-galactosidase
MKPVKFSILLVLSLFPYAAGARTVENFDSGWRFLQADLTNAEQIKFDDSAWMSVSVPHDWSIAGPISQTNATGGAGAFMPSGISWYRKHFSPPDAGAGESISIVFDGVMQNSDVWINGFHLGHRPSGYVGFSYDLTGHLNASGDNVIAVRTDTSAQPASRWYSGAGIYRHVRLISAGPARITENGVFISTPTATKDQSTVRILTSLTNASGSPLSFKLHTELLSPEGGKLAEVDSGAEMVANAGTVVEQEITVSQPQLWDLDKPVLYHAVSKIVSGGKTLDSVTSRFGIREAKFDAGTGFWLNGKNFKVNGVCLHQDGGAFGVAVPKAVWVARLNTLKSLGVNAVRTAHSPPSPEFLDVCDETGMLVMDEMFDCWTVSKNPYDYHLFFDEWSSADERDAILRDRNHPSVILYSVGNEIHDTPQAEKAKRILARLVAVAHEADPTRPVTQALFRPNVSHDYDDGLADMLDVVGQNYREKEILAAHDQKPTRKIIGTENTHDRNQWVAVRDHAPYAGQFIWTGIDYLGESRHWPIFGHASGLLDRTGAIRPLARERQSWWSEKPMVAIARRLAPNDAMPDDPGYGAEERHTQVLFADWTPRNGLPHNENVEVYSNCKEVELFLNGQSLGTKPINPEAAPRTWSVPFAPGILKAVAHDDAGNIAATDELRTAGAPAGIKLVSNAGKLAPDWEDVAEVRATIVDKDGIEISRANDLVTFKVSGPGVIAAVDNGDNSDHGSFLGSERHAYLGECVVYVKAGGPSGTMVVTASAPGLADGSVNINLESPEHH